MRGGRVLGALLLATALAGGCRAPSVAPPVTPPSPPAGASASGLPTASAATPNPGSSRTATQRPAPVKGRVGRVTRVSDGDTVVVDGERVRLIGIDAPESVAPGQPVECYGRDASARLKGLLPVGTAVRLQLDPANGDEPDRYGRALAYVYRERDGLFLNLILVREGFAVAYPYGQTRLHRAKLQAAEDQARAERRGLWRTCRVRGS